MKNILSLISTLVITFNVFSSNLTIEKKYEVIVPDLNIPWSFVFLTENSILITEKTGKLILFENGIKKIINGLPEIVDIG